MKYSFGRFLVYVTNHIISRIFFSSIRMAWYRHVMKYNVGHNSSILTDFKISGRKNLAIGRNTVINNGCRFDNRFMIAIANNVSITYGTVILTKGHDIEDPMFATKGSPVFIDDYVWICARVTILPGVKINKGAVVLSGSVVTKDVPAYHVVGGNPAKFVKKRSQNQIYELDFDPWVPFFG